MELSIDTSTRYASVAVSHEGQSIAELTWHSERNHSVELVPAIREIMGRARVGIGQLAAIFIAKGPGAFSALRVGISTGKALSIGLKVPLLSVATLDIEARPYLGLGIPVRAVIPGGRDRVYLGKYAAQGTGGEPEYCVVNQDELGLQADVTTLFCGEGVRAVADLLHAQVGERALVADVPLPTRRASVLAYLGWRKWRAGDIDDAAALQPLYLRSSQVDVAHRAWSLG